jgi:hypothetical protein
MSNDPSKLSPSEIDTILADIWSREEKVESFLKSEQASLASHEAAERGERYIGTGRSRRSTWKRYPQDVERLKAAIAEHEAALAALQAEAAPYNDEYRRRYWHRYFLVLNPGGHIHRDRHCSTCRIDTRYGWLPELSGITEAEMVAKHGIDACTVCFPSAPAHPAYIQAQLDAEKAEKAKNDSKCPGGAKYSSRHGGRYDYCPDCGAYTSLSSNGKYRAHKRPAA